MTTTPPILRRTVLGALLATTLLASTAFAEGGDHWVSTWAAAPDLAGPELKPQTIRQVMRVSAGGRQVRVRLSNLFGSQPLVIGPVHLALPADGPAIQPGTDRALAFGGRATVTIPPGESVLSDAVPMNVAPLQSLVLSLYLPQGSGPSTVHSFGLQTVYLAEGGDATAAPRLPDHQTDDSRYFVTDIEVAAAGESARTLVALGDSLTDGVGSMPDQPSRWTDALAERMQTNLATAHIGVANVGIAGNRLLRDGVDPFIGQSALARLDRDVMGKPNVRWILLFEGTNDITAADMLPLPQDQPSAERIIEGMKSLIQRAHASGVSVWGGTLLPRGVTTGKWLQTPAAEAKRLAVNSWIRQGKAFDAVVDFDQVVRDPAHPERLRAEFDSGDHVHPNDAGYRAMAAAVDLGLLKP